MKYINDLRMGIENLIKNGNCYVIGEDIQEPYGGAFKVTKGLSDKYPNNIIGTPMCEQGFTGLGVGMALYGCQVIVEIMFGDFITLTADQMINHAAKFRELYGENISLVLRCPSGAYRGYGATHSQSLEKMYMGMPGIQVVSASIAYSPGELLAHAVQSGIPTLFVENKLDYPRELLAEEGRFWKREVLHGDNAFPVAKIIPLEDTPEVTIITYGGMVDLALSAMEALLYDDEICVEIIVAGLLTDCKSLLDACQTSNVWILEEGVKDFGWGSEMCSLFAEQKGIISRRIGAENRVIPSSKREEHIMLPSVDGIVCAIREGV